MNHIRNGVKLSTYKSNHSMIAKLTVKIAGLIDSYGILAVG